MIYMMYIILVVFIIRYWLFVCFFFYKVECVVGMFFNIIIDMCEMCLCGFY